jgi:hypothetical protein
MCNKAFACFTKTLNSELHAWFCIVVVVADGNCPRDGRWVVKTFGHVAKVNLNNIDRTAH